MSGAASQIGEGGSKGDPLPQFPLPPGECPRFITGKLAEESLRQTLDTLAHLIPFGHETEVLPITVAALMTPRWIARHITISPRTTRIVLPGYCDGDLAPLREKTHLPIHVGPKDLRRLNEYLGAAFDPPDLRAHQIEILAEINHAPRLSRSEFIALAESYSADGADWIDVGCDPTATPWAEIGDFVHALRDLGLRVSVDSLDVREIAAATAAGAELVLSVNRSNRHAAADWGAEVVAIPDDPEDLDSLEATRAYLLARGVPHRLDPILAPIGFGFHASLQRYAQTRTRYPDAELLMGIGNLTELSDVDSAGVNFLLLAICEELGIRAVLTTQVIPWAQTSVRECEVARRIVHHALAHRVLPKRLTPDLVMLRDVERLSTDEEFPAELARRIRDPNVRVFATRAGLHLVGAATHCMDSDPRRVFARFVREFPRSIDAAHAFYLGYELAKAHTARTLGKSYTQDETLHWGMLTAPETSFHPGPTSRGLDDAP